MSIARIIRCDECGVELDEDAAMSWLCIDIAGIDARPIGSGELPAHLCSGACLLKFGLHVAETHGVDRDALQHRFQPSRENKAEAT